MFRATAAKAVLSRRASLVESSEQVKIEAAILAELRKGLYSVTEAVLAKDDSNRNAARLNATAAYESAQGLSIAHLCPSQSQVFRKSCGGSNQPSEAISCLDSARKQIPAKDPKDFRQP